MSEEARTKAKRVWKKYKSRIIFAGGFIIGATITYKFFRRTEIKIKEKIPEWAEKWEVYCFDNNRLMETGLPIFASDDQTKIFRDAFSPEVDIQDFIDAGYEIVERA